MLNRRPNKRGPVAGGDMVLFLGVAAVVIGLVAVWFVAWAAASLAGHGHGGPARWLVSAGEGPRWSAWATVWAAVMFTVLIGGVVALVLAIRSAWSHREWTDSLAGSMSSRRDLAELTVEAVAEDTRRLGSEGAGEGIRVAVAVLTGQWLASTYEWSMLWIMGTRAGKTRSVAVPMLVEHGGAAVATSNKPDIVFKSRGPRSELGACWIQDPQDIYREGATWWWDPVSFVTTTARAEQLAGIWLASRSAGDVGAADAYFEPMGRELLADLLLAAAKGHEPVTRVLEWIQFPDGRPGLPDPCQILRAAGLVAVADNIEAKVNKSGDERSGIYGTAQSACGWLRSPEFLPWICRQGADDTRPQFNPVSFVRTTQTLYLLSREGEGSARAITGALTAAVYAAAEELAFENGGRVPTPILFVLDEAANVCRWPQLPSLYSYAGSLGIILITILQSEKQGKGAWGENGFGMMVSAANLMGIGRGLNDEQHLTGLARLIGDRQIRDTSLTVGKAGHRSTSTSNRDERILTEADLRAIPRGRGVLFPAGARPVLIRLVDHSEREDASRIEASEAAYRMPWHPDTKPETDSGNDLEQVS